MKQFIEVIWEFSNSTIDQEEEEEEEADQEAASWKDAVARHKILQLKGSTIPRGLVPLEMLFNTDGIVIKQIAPEMDDQVQDCNIGLAEEPQMISCQKESPCIINRGIYIFSKPTNMFFIGLMMI